MKTRLTHSPRARQNHSRRGIMLIDCVVYLGLFFVVLGVSFPLFYCCWDGSLSLRRNTDDISTTLRVGEAWRADIRQAIAPLHIENSPDGEVLRIPQKSGEAAYKFSVGSLFRRPSATSDWSEILPQVKSSHMQTNHRQFATAWRWEIELVTRSKTSRIHPLFTFEAATPVPVSKP